MTLQKQKVDLPFAQGLDTKTDPHHVQPGKFLELINARFTRPGEIAKRYGFESFGTSVDGGFSITAGAALAARGNELVLFAGPNDSRGSKVYSYLASTGTWSDRGAAVQLQPTVRRVRRVHTEQELNPDVCVSAGLEVTAWEDSGGGIRYAVVDTSTGATIVAYGQVSSTGTRPKIVLFNSKFTILYTETTNLKVKTIATSTPSTLSSSSTLVTDGHGTPASFVYDACVIGSELLVGYLSSTPSQKLKSFDTTFTNTATQVVDNIAGNVWVVATEQCVTVVADATIPTAVWIAWGSGVASRYARYPVPLGAATLSATALAAKRITTITGYPNGGSLQTAVENYDADDTKRQIQVYAAAPNGSVADVMTLRSVGLVSKMWTHGLNGSLYVVAAHGSDLQPTYFVIDTIFQRVVARLAYAKAGALSSNNMLSEAMTVSSGVFEIAGGERGKLITESGVAFGLVGAATYQLDFTHARAPISVEYAGDLIISGALPQMYDGVGCVELGFNLYPEGVSVALNGSGGSIEAGARQWIAVYEWTDNVGNIHRGAISVAVPKTTVASDKATITVPTLRLTSKTATNSRGQVSIAIYRTLAAGTIFYRVTDILAPLQNDTTADTVSFVDTASDVNIAANELLYTTGAVLDNMPPPPFSMAVVWGGRVILAGLEDPTEVAYSKLRFDTSTANTIPAEFPAEFRLNVGATVTGLGVLDDKLVIFTATATYILSGEGPTDTGGGNPFGAPQLLTTDAGCVNAKSVRGFPGGLMFESAKGIYALDQSLSVSYIGAPVEAYNSLTISAAVLLASQNVVVFTTSDGAALVYDYSVGQWCTWDNHVAVDALVRDDGQGPGPRLFRLKSDGTVHAQQPGFYTDGADFDPIGLSWTTAWFQMAGLNGAQRIYNVYLLGTFVDGTDVTASFGYDFAATFESVPTFAAASPFQYRIDPKTQRCTAFRIKVVDVPTNNGQGYSISGLSAWVGVQPGGAKLPATQQKAVA